VQRRLKSALTHLGAHCPPSLLHNLNATVSYLDAGRWMRDRGFDASSRMATREDVFDAVAATVADEQVLYLEFGVFKGDSMRYWSRRLGHPGAQLHGFDSFVGLPADWTAKERRGHFSTSGRTPGIQDPRVVFFKGWFEDTLPRYTAPPHERLVANVDCDLYSSATIVLYTIEPLLVPGAYLYFDEFHDRANERRAFDELLERTGMTFELVAASRELTHVAFRRTR
jgi:hypothetical protein